MVCGRRREPLEQVAAELGGGARAVVMDVTDPVSVATAAAEIGACDVLVNNAGGAIGAETVENGRPQDWRDMYESNVLGVLHVTQAFLPLLRRSTEGGTVVVVSSIAGLAVYEGGAGYTTAKHAATAFAETLRLELSGEPIRVVEIDPGMVHTEGFSLTRYRGDQDQADAGVCRRRPAAGRRRRRRVHRVLRRAAPARQRRPAGRQAGGPGGAAQGLPRPDRLAP